MKKRDIIKKNQEFQHIINNGKFVKNRFFSVYFVNADKCMYGISVPKKTGNAVLRNKIKRQIKNIIDHNEKYIQNNRHYVIIIKRSVLDLSYKQCEINLLDLFMKSSY